MTALSRRSVLRGSASVIALGAAAAVTCGPVAALPSPAEPGLFPGPNELSWRYLAFLDYERSMLAAELGAEAANGSIFVKADLATHHFFRPWFGADPSRERAEYRALRVLAAAGVSFEHHEGDFGCWPVKAGRCAALAEEWLATVNAPFVSDEQSDAAGDRLTEIEDALVEMPAVSAADVIGKARVLAEWERQGITHWSDSPKLAASLLADLERLGRSV